MPRTPERTRNLRRAGAVYWPARHLWIIDTAASDPTWSGPPAVLHLTSMGWAELPAPLAAEARRFYAEQKGHRP